MARVTVEDCLARVPNRFALTILASRRARALGEGRGRALVDCDNKEGVTALREVSKSRVRFKEDVPAAMRDFIEEQRRQLRVTAGEHTFLEAASLRALEEDEGEADEEEGEIEELPPDPEALNKQAATVEGGVVGADDDAEETEFDEEAGFGDEDLPEEAGDITPPEADEDVPADDEEEEPEVADEE